MSTILAAAGVAAPGVALGVLVREYGARGLEHGLGNDVLRGDQLDLVLLAIQLLADRVGDLRIAVGDGGGEKAGLRGTLGLHRKHRVLSLVFTCD
jgi:hypothetical protein